MKLSFASLGLMLLAASFSSQTVAAPDPGASSAQTLHDAERDRQIPLQLYPLPHADRCTRKAPCPVAIISPGYGLEHTQYVFLAEALNELGYLVVAVQHQLPSDAPLAVGDDLFAARTPNWQQGAANLRFVMDALSKQLPNYTWSKPLLAGHSNGGDISAWYIRERPEFDGTLMTLDHRRVPLPRSPAVRVLSIRASDFAADAAVLPTADEATMFGICVVTLRSARHNDLNDQGAQWIKTAITDAVGAFVREKRCTDGLDS